MIHFLDPHTLAELTSKAQEFRTAACEEETKEASHGWQIVLWGRGRRRIGLPYTLIDLIETRIQG